MEEPTAKEQNFDDKVKEIRQWIATRAKSPVEQHAIASAVLHHFDFKLRMIAMEKHQPKTSLNLVDALRLDDGEDIWKKFEVKLSVEAPDKVAPKEDKQWIAKEGDGKFLVKRVQKPNVKKPGSKKPAAKKA